MFSIFKKISSKKGEKVVGVVFMVSWLWIALLVIYGATFWLYAPIRCEGGQFLDKKGNPFTESEFLQFKAWETTLFWSFIGFTSVLLLAHWILHVPIRWRPKRTKRDSEKVDAGG